MWTNVRLTRANKFHRNHTAVVYERTEIFLSTENTLSTKCVLNEKISTEGFKAPSAPC